MTETADNLPQPGSFDQDTFAAIDIGSNSFHLIVARLANGTLQPLVMDKQLVRLAQGLSDDRILSDDAIERGVTILRSFARILQGMDPARVRAVATFTLRRARNRNAFLRAAREVFPFPIEVISGDEEARLIYQGVAHTTHFEGKRLILDIGGGSTEFAIGEKFELLQLSSQPMGCISYTRRFFDDGRITRERFRQAETAARQRLEIIDQRFERTGWDAAIGCSGTAKAILAYANHLGLAEEGQISRKVLKQLRSSLVNLGQAELIEGIDEGRRPVLAGGLSIMLAAFKQFDIENLVVSDAALREGVLYELTERMEHHDIRERTVSSLVSRFDIDIEQTRRVYTTAKLLFGAISKQLPADQIEPLRHLLYWGCTLHEIGLHINRRGLQRHSRYIIENLELPGFSDEEQKLLALLCGSWRKSFKRKDIPDFALYDEQSIFLLVLVLRLATLMNLRRLDGFLPELKLDAQADRLSLGFTEAWLDSHPLTHADLQTEAALLANNSFKLILL